VRVLVASALVAAAFAGQARAAPFAVRPEAHPMRVGVGDPFTYVVEARIPRDGLDLSSVRVVAGTAPFAPLAEARTSRRQQGSFVYVTLAQRLACLDTACAPRDRDRSVALPSAYASARSNGRVARAAAAPTRVSVVPRLSSAAVRASPPRYRLQTNLPGPRRDAARLARLLVGAAAALGILAAVLGFAAIRPRRRPAPGEPRLSRALRLLRESADRPPPDRRRAADLLSRVAAAERRAALADEALRVAWAPAIPEPARARELADRAERGHERP